ncbi:MAG TPA: hypothetical protein PLR08_03520 [bacterium]|nr:hypothetical protein [Candidatus Magasanikbacteria bacterium]HPF95591.1 hypothetical protein [bacterium]
MTRIHDIFFFVEGCLVIFLDPESQQFSGRYIADSNALALMLKDHRDYLPQRYLEDIDRTVLSGKVFSSPAAGLERSYNHEESRYLCKRLQKMKELSSSKQIVKTLLSRRTQLCEFKFFHGVEQKYVAIGIKYSDAQHSVALLTSYEDATALFRLVGMSDDELLFYQGLLLKNGFPEVRPTSEQVYFWGQMAFIINVVALKEKISELN